jgi:hypothetical protein
MISAGNHLPAFLWIELYFLAHPDRIRLKDQIALNAWQSDWFSSVLLSKIKPL